MEYPKFSPRAQLESELLAYDHGAVAAYEYVMHGVNMILYSIYISDLGPFPTPRCFARTYFYSHARRLRLGNYCRTHGALHLQKF